MSATINPMIAIMDRMKEKASIRALLAKKPKAHKIKKPRKSKMS